MTFAFCIVPLHNNVIFPDNSGTNSKVPIDSRKDRQFAICFSPRLHIHFFASQERPSVNTAAKVFVFSSFFEHKLFTKQMERSAWNGRIAEPTEQTETGAIYETGLSYSLEIQGDMFETVAGGRATRKKCRI